MSLKFLLAILFVFLSCTFGFAQTSAFTYQGRLTDGGAPANGTYDVQFKLFDTATTGTGTQQGPTITNDTLSVANGIFTVQLDFGAGVFSGPPRFLEIAVRPAGNPNPYNVLAPRQPVTATPYAVRSLNSSVADTLSSSCVGCVTNTQVGSVNGSAVAGTIPVASVPAGSTNYLQNTTNQQTSSNFNISGNGIAGGTLSANAVNTTTQYNIGGNRMLSAPGTNNLFAGAGAGNANTSFSNSFFGTNAGLATSSGCCNSFFGSSAGKLNTTGLFNSFFGQGAGASNVSGNSNAFFGTGAGLNSTTNANSFFGSEAGNATTSGAGNSFFGERTGFGNTTGGSNTFVGVETGGTNTAGNNNTLIGAGADVGNAGGFPVNFGTAIGAGAVVNLSNTVVLGRASDVVNIPGSYLDVTGDVTANSYAIHSERILFSPGSSNTILGITANVGAANLTFATAIGSGAVVNNNNSVVLGRSNDTVRVPGGLNVTGSAVVNGGMIMSGNTIFSDNVSFLTLGSAGSTSLCRNASNQIATCSSSLRYKTSVQPFIGGLDVVRRLRPIAFNWRDGGRRDVGFAAEEVNTVEPLLITRNDKGEIEGVKYAQLTTVLVNSINEQQGQIEALRKENATLNLRLRALERIVKRKARR